jgi:hypothetical protein
MLLIGQFGSLVELDMSGTSIETLDLSAIQAQNLKRIFLLGCEKLRAILWPHEENKKIKLEVLRIDTTHITWAEEDASKKEDSTSGDFTSIESQSTTMHGNNKSFTYSDSYISLRDIQGFFDHFCVSNLSNSYMSRFLLLVVTKVSLKESVTLLAASMN